MLQTYSDLIAKKTLFANLPTFTFLVILLAMLALPAFARVGKLAALVIPVEFQDVKSMHTKEQIEEFFDLVHDYYYDISNGRFEYTNIVTPIITLPYDKLHYENQDNRQPIIADALDILAAMDFDISEVTINDNNRVQALNIFYAGSGFGAHQGTHYSDVTISGVGVRLYQMSGMGTDGNLRKRLSAVVHESGHLVPEPRWPDLYYSGADPEFSFGLRRWCVMADGTGDGSWPQQPNIYLRHLSGWADAIDITNAAPGTEFSIEANGNKAFVYRRNDKEAYFIEARLRKGRDSLLPGSGLAIWHIHTDGSNISSSPGFPRVALVQADGRNDLYYKANSGDNTDLFRAGVRTKFNSTTSPAAIWHDGTPSGISISHISDTGAVMTFRIGDGDYEDKMQPKYKFYNDVMSYARATENVEAVVDENFTLDDMLISIPAPKTPGITLTIRSAGTTPAIIKRGVIGNLFTVGSGRTLILENIIIDGGGNANFGKEECYDEFDDDGNLIGDPCEEVAATGGGGTLVRVNAGGTLIMKEGAVLRNNVNSDNGGGVYIYSNGIFNMNGGEISGNTAATGGGVRINSATSVFTMQGGKISGNSGNSATGGVSVIGTFTMNGGEISNNTAATTSGGVATSGTFTMNAGGKISGNIAGTDGGGVRVSGGTFTMNGGEISGNTASNWGGGVRISGAASAFTLQNGKISDNIAGTRGGGVSISDGLFTMNGGEIVGNTAATDGGAIRFATGTSNINGGLIFGVGATAASVVSGTHNLNKSEDTPNNAAIIAWNKPSGTLNYTLGTSDNLTASSGATAVWANKDGKLGIQYENGENTGFIAISESGEFITPIKIPQITKTTIKAHYANKTIMLENVPANAKVEVYNLQGKRIYNSQLSTFNSQLRIGVQTGFYIVRVNNQILRVAAR
ncbi:MAG: T9SS type A sorting domain-containing protein [Fibromonadales bacterium]|nr:T9SS type A sorting domain-containing protein [Fibromonadales bacterium]